MQGMLLRLREPAIPCHAFGRSVAGFSDAVRDVWAARGVAWRRRSAQAGNRGVGPGGWFVAMGICAVRVLLPGADTPVGRGALALA